MTLEGKAKRVRIYVSEGDLVGHRPVHLAIVELLRNENAAGATVFRAIEGFGGSREMHVSHLVELGGALPILIEWVDSAERVDQLLGKIKGMIVHGMITVEDTHVSLFIVRPLRCLSGHATAGEVMSRDVASVERDTPVRDVVELLLGKVYRAVPVVDDGRPAGIITNTNLLTHGGLRVRVELLPALDRPEIHAELERLSLERKRAEEIMTVAPVTVATTTPLTEVATLMTSRRLKRIPVVDGTGRLAGMLSRLDLLRSVATCPSGADAERDDLGLNGSTPISSIMRTDVPTVGPDTPVAEVLGAVASTRLNRALVVDERRLVLGMVTDAELLERVTPALRPSVIHSVMSHLRFLHPSPEQVAIEHRAVARTASDLMVGPVATTQASATIAEALRPMLGGMRKLVAVVDADGRLLGVVDRADLLRGISELGQPTSALGGTPSPG